MSEGTNLYDIFEDINVLQSREPNYFRFSNVRIFVDLSFIYALGVSLLDKVFIRRTAYRITQCSLSQIFIFLNLIASC